MNYFEMRDGVLHAEDVPLPRIVERVGTPCYVYSARTLARHYHVVDASLSEVRHLVCYSVKANANLGVLAELARLGAGFDVVSGGELFRVRRAGGDPRKVVFSGVGKTREEMRQALHAGILMFNVESRSELLALDAEARALGLRAPVALRVNPDVDPLTHPYIATGLRKSKFGVTFEQAHELYREAQGLGGIDLRGVDCHIGSQLTDLAPVREALGKVVALVDELGARGQRIEVVDVGGGIGIPYDQETTPPSPQTWGAEVRAALGQRDLLVVAEPGRVIVGNAGILVTRVLYVKERDDKRFLVVDAGMNDAIRPALYGAYHGIVPVHAASGLLSAADVVGPVCESADFLAQDRPMPQVSEGDLLAMTGAGAYGFVMSSNYNARPRAAEVLVRGAEVFVVRQRETLEDLVRGEHVP